MNKPLNQSFDSILVRVKVLAFGLLLYLATPFRFHTGSIKSGDAGNGKWTTRLKFRFHTGSIKSAFARTLFRDTRSFDSILVRLKGFKFNKTKADIRTFRFHTGSIKSEKNRVGSLPMRKFRFHTGSIKRRRKLGVCHPGICFDSILVRLKGTLHDPRVAPKCFVSIPYWFD